MLKRRRQRPDEAAWADLEAAAHGDWAQMFGDAAAQPHEFPSDQHMLRRRVDRWVQRKGRKPLGDMGGQRRLWKKVFFPPPGPRQESPPPTPSEIDRARLEMLRRRQTPPTPSEIDRARLRRDMTMHKEQQERKWSQLKKPKHNKPGTPTPRFSPR
jgi:hypothetical protein